MKKVIEALQYYADENNYVPMTATEEWDNVIPVLKDKGSLAREALPFLADSNIIFPAPKGLSFTMSWVGKGVGKNKKLVRVKGGKMFRNTLYKNFLKTMEEQFKLQGKVIPGEVRVTMKICCHSRADHHNFIEPILDGLQNSGCIENDVKAAEIILPRPERHGNKEPDRFIIKVEGLV